MKSAKTFFILFMGSMLFTNCSTMFNSGSQTIRVMTNNEKQDIRATITTKSRSYQTKVPTTIVATPSSFQQVNISINDACY